MDYLGNILENSTQSLEHKVNTKVQTTYLNLGLHLSQNLIFKAMKELNIDLQELISMPITQLGDFWVRTRRKKRPNKNAHPKVIKGQEKKKEEMQPNKKTEIPSNQQRMPEKTSVQLPHLPNYEAPIIQRNDAPNQRNVFIIHKK